MNSPSHKSAAASHYNQGAEQYDIFNEQRSREINKTIETILQKHRVKSVLDFTCGTGSQVFWLAKRGYELTGVDINARMLTVAREKAVQCRYPVILKKGDIRTSKVGTFDAVISIFNAVGHLTKEDFETAMRTVHENLRDGGLYLFDIFNLSYLLDQDNITKLTIDWQEEKEGRIVRDIQYSTINEEGVLASYTTSYVDGKKVSQGAQTLQVYRVQELKEMLERTGFQVIRRCAVDGRRFVEKKTERLLMVAKKSVSAASGRENEGRGR